MLAPSKLLGFPKKSEKPHQALPAGKPHRMPPGDQKFSSNPKKSRHTLHHLKERGTHELLLELGLLRHPSSKKNQGAVPKKYRVIRIAHWI
jgi:hypothetical protein